MADSRERWLIEYRFGVEGGRWWSEWDHTKKIADAKAMKEALQAEYPGRDWRIRKGIPRPR